MKKKFLLYITLTCIGILTFNFLSPEKETDNIKDIVHQKSFNLNFRSYSLVTPDSVGFAGEYAGRQLVSRLRGDGIMSSMLGKRITKKR